MDQPGLLEWCNATRLFMANDPGRQLFQDQIQSHGFLFLTDYLDTILAGPRRDPLIELVKTPGRKRVSGKRPVAASSALKSVVALSLEALLQVRDKPSAPESSVCDVLRHPPKLDEKLIQDFPVFSTPILPPSPAANAVSEVHQAQLLIPPPLEQNDLSVIAEDDEAERSRTSLLSGRLSGFPAQHSEQEIDIAAGLETSLSSTDTFQTIPPSATQTEFSDIPSSLASPSASPSRPHMSPLPPITTNNSLAANHAASLSELTSSYSAHNATEPLPSSLSSQSAQSRDDITEPLPSSLPVFPEAANSTEIVPSFPSLPAPAPFRKSIRAPPDSSAAPAPLGATTPGGALGKRTSWLIKAREVKAREITIKKPDPLRSVTTGPAGGTKRKSMDMVGTSTMTGLEHEERYPKVAKILENDVGSMNPTISDGRKQSPEQDVDQLSTQSLLSQEGLLVQLKKTMDGLGARLGKSMGKSLGGAAATNALAEARAAAEARIAERHHQEEEATKAFAPTSVIPSAETAALLTLQPTAASQSHLRLSVSELVTSSESKGEGKVSTEKPDMNLPSAHSTSPEQLGDMTNTTTPPDSPSPGVFHMIPGGPVFNKPVFVPPAAPASQALSFKLATTNNTFYKPASIALGLAPRLPSPKPTATVPTATVPLSSQSTLESVQSDGLFDAQEVPAWMPSTQDTNCTSVVGSPSQCSPPRGLVNDLDDDDSWPLQERLAAGMPWFVNSKEDSLTWSTLPTSSQRRDTGPMPQGGGSDANCSTDDRGTHHNAVHELLHPIPGSFHMDVDDEYEDACDAAVAQGVGDMETDPTKSTVSLVDPPASRSQSQMSIASTASSHSQGGFLGHASKFVTSMLGASKTAKPEVKSLQLAAVAAKKQQEEKEKKANRLKEMENRRQAALQRKADEEKAKVQDEERRLKGENERRKRERDEHTEKRPVPKSVGTKKVDRTTTTSFILTQFFVWQVTEADKKPELKKAALKPALNASTSSKHLSKSALAKPQSALLSSATYNTASTSNVNDAANVQSKGKLPTKNVVPHDDISQPSQILQTQMAARAKAQLQAANLAPPPIPSESIELPDINSEYSDSDDEDRPRSFNPPSWAQSPDLRQALEIQSTINPDDIFGAIRPLKMDELFKNRTGRFRARTSSANWTGTDRLTVEEEREYVRRMGFK
ncbi:hypothetical protein GGX14DRAFT_639397 [Mycena pura]|uniref:Inner centromere protein ARK-binding domain-containing protein n=1 Tax=Mycena pura TaxID=153505 RepID=A0AAD6YPB0_9AGAR|nr:hypothetical protein GGX14DRAFT_639397 [Mycena pura]